MRRTQGLCALLLGLTALGGCGGKSKVREAVPIWQPVALTTDAELHDLTEDGGESWRLVRHGAGEGLRDLHFIDRWSGWAVGGGGVLSTVDGGEHWHWAIRSSSENGYLSGSAVQFLDRSTGWMGAGAGSGRAMASPRRDRGLSTSCNGRTAWTPSTSKVRRPGCS